MIINESWISATSLSDGDYFIDDDELYLTISVDSEGNHYVVTAKELMTDKVIEIRYDSNDKVKTADKKDVTNFRVSHFQKVTGIKLHKDYDKGNYIAISTTQRKVDKAVKDYNKKYRTGINNLGLDYNDGSIRLIF